MNGDECNGNIRKELNKKIIISAPSRVYFLCLEKVTKK
jgi:hypothetical protein